MGKVKDGTPKEIHSRAVALRKMTDAQLVAQVTAAHRDTAALFIEELKAASIPGIGKVTVKKIETFAREKGYTSN
ncbi:MAG: hypothetical protein K2J77_13160 [Oscillospiraceae bacterium]|nr:hypothetical protein [Oscillospiraceae bacterium]